MSTKIICQCGEWLRYGDIPNQIEYLFISDVEYDNVIGSIDAEELYRRLNHFLKCPNCGRLHIFWEGFGKEQKIYTPED